MYLSRALGTVAVLITVTRGFVFLSARYADFGVRAKSPDRGRKDRGGGHGFSFLFVSPRLDEKGLRLEYDENRKKIVLKFTQFVLISEAPIVKCLALS